MLRTSDVRARCHRGANSVQVSWCRWVFEKMTRASIGVEDETPQEYLVCNMCHFPLVFNAELISDRIASKRESVYPYELDLCCRNCWCYFVTNDDHCRFHLLREIQKTPIFTLQACAAGDDGLLARNGAVRKFKTELLVSGRVDEYLEELSNGFFHVFSPACATGSDVCVLLHGPNCVVELWRCQS